MRTLTLLLLLVSALSAQSRSRYLAIQKFRGTLDFTLVQSGNEFGLDYTVRASATATFILERTTGNTPTWSGRMVDSNTSIRYSATQTTNGCTSTIAWDAAGPLLQGRSPENHDVRITMFAENWNFFVPRYFGPTVPVTVRTVCPGNQVQVQNQTAALVIPNDIPANAFPSSGTSLRFSQRVTDPSRYSPLSAQEYTWICNVNIEPFEDELDLEITSSAYQTWRPTAKKEGDFAGEPIQITATLVRRSDGQPVPQDVRSFEWELLETSSEPGIAINWPQSAKDKDFDMRFRPTGDQFLADDKAQKMTRQLRNQASDVATVVPIDWGGWSRLRVKVTLLDGREIIGKLKGANESDLRLPRRKANSYIADVVKEEWRVDKADTADDDPLNSSERSGNGDGLTLYEEYRGFYEDGAHSMGRPSRQEYFAVNKLKASGEAGMAVFERLSGLRVIMIREDEYSPTRVVNANYANAPHRVDQHGVLFVSQNDMDERIGGMAFGGPATPKSIEMVGINSADLPADNATANLNPIALVIAHEALHTVNVWHHGENDDYVVWESSNGVLVENGVAITVLDENNENVTSKILTQIRGRRMLYYLGRNGGQNSGDDECVLRYDVADTYVDNNNPRIRRVFGGVRDYGASLCNRKIGTGVNDRNRKPQSRFGDASVGDCKSQILVNDALPAPKRGSNTLQ